jgi:uncharacterized protein
MMFEWDEAKRLWNISDRGIDFADMMPAFTSPDAIVVEDGRKNYGERRFNLLCPLNTILFHITFTTRGEMIRIISARRANQREREAYARKKHQ